MHKPKKSDVRHKKYIIVNPIHLSLHSESKMLYSNKTTSPNPRKKTSPSKKNNLFKL